VDFHARFGGVVPEIASRKHIEAICGVCDEALDAAAASLARPSVRWRDLDAVAVTYAPGLVGALVVGVAFAKGAAWGADIPFIVVNHLEGHLYANKIGLPDFAPPAVVSLVSGGNTLLVSMAGWGDYKVLGATIDDAVGEAFDKVAKALGLGYPGGPVVSKFAAEGDPAAIPFPRAMLHSGDFSFSLSGLKTAVVTYINNERAAGRTLNVPDICASFEAAVVDVQVAKARTALRETGAPTFCLGGGVAANPALRAAYEKMCAEEGVRLVMPPLASCGDNAGMIAEVALDRYRAGAPSPRVIWSSRTRENRSKAGEGKGSRRTSERPPENAALKKQIPRQQQRCGDSTDLRAPSSLLRLPRLEEGKREVGRRDPFPSPTLVRALS
jgi:N6-L-threonylcarbamoyladenine synthase